MRLLSTVVYFILSVLLLSSCEERRQDTEDLTYVAQSKRDSARLDLNLFESRFHGKLWFYRPGGEVDSGDIRGNIQKDTLIGDYYYTPFGWGQKKRRPLVLLKKGSQYILGTGTEQVYMGIPHFIPSTINFRDPKFIFVEIDR
ncbi:MAG: hypothetical protein LBV59_22690 [Sphingobacterium sp.]|uniref:hypothetical protein n=1 Tax=Sphingobacterium sp. TaxID=341027 RepID=UPI00284B909F|nr:hypothetical protein [Sphingobacterium sp.]MDR3010751.1 hypothetical protein [Sphingobacterium sp.]